MSDSKIATLILGGTGYVAGELLRLIVGHPRLELAGVMSESRAGARIRDTFPQLQANVGDMTFGTKAELLDLLTGQVALFSAAPHGASAALVGEFIERADDNACRLNVVDVSADFRFADADAYAAVYGQPHGAPDLLAQFASGVPEHMARTDRTHVGHPGCFATSLLLAAVPLLQLELAGPEMFAVGITGSTGSGRTPTAGTHHPERHSNLFAYKPLVHRHAPEVTGLCEQATGRRPALRFIPHSGPFARGIHLTLQAPRRLGTGADNRPAGTGDVLPRPPVRRGAGRDAADQGHRRQQLRAHRRRRG